jgi:hypothetical protein
MNTGASQVIEDEINPVNTKHKSIFRRVMLYES